MSLWLELRVGSRTSLGYMEIIRDSNRTIENPSPELVSQYRIMMKGIERGRVDHRYGDGGWVLLGKAIAEVFGKWYD